MTGGLSRDGEGPGGLALHSRYNPRREAERYIGSLSLREDTRCFLLIEPGLGYCIPPLRQRFPRAKIIALHLSGLFDGPGAAAEPGASWNPGLGVPVQRFLEDEVPEGPAALVKIVEWRPALRVFGEAYLRLLGDCADFIKRLDAGERTLRQFGGRWFKNFFKNTGLLRKIPVFSPLDLPALVAGAGPSLEDALPLIRERREGLFVLAVSSSVAALEEGGISPDLVISTDGGNWALPHLYEGLRRRKPALAAGLSAALPSQCAALPVLPISDGSLWQRLVLERLGVPFISLPQRGTVSASALDLAFSLCRGKVLITGLDLAHRDLRTHARPYAFDRLWEENATRLDPAYSRRFVREAGISAGGSQAIYAAWFRQQLASWPRRLYSLGGNNPVFKGMEIGGGDFFSREDFQRPRPLYREQALSLPEDLPRRGAEILRRALGEGPYGAELGKELASIFGLDDPSPAFIEAEIGRRLKKQCRG